MEAVVDTVAASFERILDRLSLALKALLVIMGLALTILIGVQVFFRYVLNNPIDWILEISLLLLVWITLVGGPLAYVEDEQIRLTLVQQTLPRPARITVQALINIGVLGIGVILLKDGHQLTTIQGGVTTQVVEIPVAFYISAIVAAGFIISLGAIHRTLTLADQVLGRDE
jgi:TRAP-type C4-dicarboxylate transport system permease small subunit